MYFLKEIAENHSKEKLQRQYNIHYLGSYFNASAAQVLLWRDELTKAIDKNELNKMGRI